MSVEVEVVDAGHLYVEEDSLHFVPFEGSDREPFGVAYVDVEHFHFERSPHTKQLGALVLVTKEDRHVLEIAKRDAHHVIVPLRKSREPKPEQPDTPEPPAPAEDRSVVDGDMARFEDDGGK